MLRNYSVIRLDKETRFSILVSLFFEKESTLRVSSPSSNGSYSKFRSSSLRLIKIGTYQRTRPVRSVCDSKSVYLVGLGAQRSRYFRFEGISGSSHFSSKNENEGPFHCSSTPFIAAWCLWTFAFEKTSSFQKDDLSCMAAFWIINI